ncbi:MAG: hypothetical protein EZS28_032549 [Streblomastix strix]|uniref:Uncharacterized protein n=1 Tax=Streblomastix strix TaxID=222440 RepID=A0A5J4UQ62_9EUKA|nr:MAG: hypothetical protein EZS28_032549 [Streblomastix strix]
MSQKSYHPIPPPPTISHSPKYKLYENDEQYFNSKTGNISGQQIEQTSTNYKENEKESKNQAVVGIIGIAKPNLKYPQLSSSPDRYCGLSPSTKQLTLSQSPLPMQHTSTISTQHSNQQSIQQIQWSQQPSMPMTQQSTSPFSGMSTSAFISGSTPFDLAQQRQREKENRELFKKEKQKQKEQKRNEQKMRQKREKEEKKLKERNKNRKIQEKEEKNKKSNKLLQIDEQDVGSPASKTSLIPPKTPTAAPISKPTETHRNRIRAQEQAVLLVQIHAFIPERHHTLIHIVNNTRVPFFIWLNSITICTVAFFKPVSRFQPDEFADFRLKFDVQFFADEQWACADAAVAVPEHFVAVFFLNIEQFILEIFACYVG